MRSPIPSCFALSALLATLACGDAAGPATLEIPPLEAVDFDAIGAGSVLFSRVNGGTYLIEATTRTVTTLPAGVAALSGPRLSPAGNRIVGLGWTDLTSCYDVYVTDLVGNEPHRLSMMTCNAESPPSWTADGSGVVAIVAPPRFVRIARPPGIYRWDAATGTEQLLREFVPDSNGNFFCPFEPSSLATPAVAMSARGGVAYACDGRLVVAATPQDSLAVLYEPAGTARVQGMAWSPDGSELAFVELDGGTSVRVLLPADGTLRNVASLPPVSVSSAWHVANRFDLCWVDGGDRIVFSGLDNLPSETGAMIAHLYVVGGDGSGLTRLTTAPAAFDHNISCLPQAP